MYTNYRHIFQKIITFGGSKKFSSGAAGGWQNPKKSKTAQNGQGRSRTPKLINMAMLYHVLGSIGPIYHVTRVIVTGFWRIRPPIYIYIVEPKRLHFCQHI